jgi:hypothetical protein
MWDIESITNDRYILADSRVYTAEGCDQMLVVIDGRDIVAKSKEVSLREGLQTLVDHYDTNTNIDQRDCHLYYLLKNYDGRLFDEFHKKVRNIQDRDCKLNFYSEEG